uniref:SUMO-activating enzyme subunit n=1 Tax=Cacopsylla melanoneura TaxID=428564 RepID=A0A8D8VI89_9HEMI
MATKIPGVFEPNLEELIKKSKVLVVGAGGIGCELLKNLVLSGFANIEIVDLDTIDVSNLNRQFLFHKQHVGKSKAKVARESALKFNPDANIVAHHASIISTDFGVNYFKEFTLVMNALDNRAARNHVNRMCLASEVPLIESGTAGYEGQVELIKKGETKCYECDPKPAAKSYPGCTIRNTPSEPIHCIVWAKHLFNQLFGEVDADEEVSPDTEDPEAVGEAGAKAASSEAKANGDVERTSTRKWAQSSGYDPQKLFTKFFNADIKYLISMSDLWKTRKPPRPLEWNSLPDAVAGSSSQVLDVGGLKDQRVWSVQECGAVFETSVKELKRKFDAALEKDEHLVWDKDDKAGMDFVAACANIRAHIFSIPEKSRFDIKSMAGNIIPAIATSNAIVAGLVVLHAIQVLQAKFQSCQTVYLRKKPNHRNQMVVPEKLLTAPNPKCPVCSPKPQRTVGLDVTKMSIAEFEEQVLKKTLNMSPMVDVMIEASGSVIISSEEGETEANNEKHLEDLGVKDGAILIADDYLQQYTLRLIISHRVSQRDGPEFEILDQTDLPTPPPQPSTSAASEPAAAAAASETPAPAAAEKMDTNGDDITSTTTPDSKKRKVEEVEEVTVEDNDVPSSPAAKKVRTEEKPTPSGDSGIEEVYLD